MSSWQFVRYLFKKKLVWGFVLRQPNIACYWYVFVLFSAFLFINLFCSVLNNVSCTLKISHSRNAAVCPCMVFTFHRSAQLLFSMLLSSMFHPLSLSHSHTCTSTAANLMFQDFFH